MEQKIHKILSKILLIVLLLITVYIIYTHVITYNIEKETKQIQKETEQIQKETKKLNQLIRLRKTGLTKCKITLHESIFSVTGQKINFDKCNLDILEELIIDSNSIKNIGNYFLSFTIDDVFYYINYNIESSNGFDNTFGTSGQYSSFSLGGTPFSINFDLSNTEITNENSIVIKLERDEGI